MRRREFLICTGLQADQYDYMLRQRHLPYLDAERRAGWADYSARQAFATALVVALAPHVGGQQEAAQRVVDLAEPEFANRVWPAMFHPERGDVWLVGENFVFVERGAAAVSIPAVALNDEAVPVVNLSSVMTGIRSRAEAAGIDFHEDIDA